MAKRNRKNNQNKQTSTSNTSMATKVFVLILAFLMVAGVATLGITLLVSTLAGPETEQTDPHAGHNH